MLFWKKQSKPQETTESVSIDRENIPQHIAVIMDGNGRWAKKRNLPRIAGHKEGMSTVKRIAIAADELGVKAMTLYAFSTENWKRPTEEVSFLMKLPGDFFGTFMPELQERNMKIQLIGFIDELPESTKKVVLKAVEDINDEAFARKLQTSFLGDLQDPDLMIRTSGEVRLSNFLLWQLAYSEYYFTDIFWPDFSEEDLHKAILTYQGRHRRYGGLA